jgi:hypothetical protein
VSDEEPVDRRAIVCNYLEATNVSAVGSRAYVSWSTGGALPERVMVLARSRHGRWINKWENTRRLGNFRAVTLPPEHPRYDDERVRVVLVDEAALVRDLTLAAEEMRERSHG